MRQYINQFSLGCAEMGGITVVQNDKNELIPPELLQDGEFESIIANSMLLLGRTPFPFHLSIRCLKDWQGILTSVSLTTTLDIIRSQQFPMIRKRPFSHVPTVFLLTVGCHWAMQCTYHLSTLYDGDLLRHSRKIHRNLHR